AVVPPGDRRQLGDEFRRDVGRRFDQFRCRGGLGRRFVALLFKFLPAQAHARRGQGQEQGREHERQRSFCEDRHGTTSPGQQGESRRTKRWVWDEEKRDSEVTVGAVIGQKVSRSRKVRQVVFKFTQAFSKLRKRLGFPACDFRRSVRRPGLQGLHGI